MGLVKDADVQSYVDALMNLQIKESWRTGIGHPVLTYVRHKAYVNDDNPTVELGPWAYHDAGLDERGLEGLIPLDIVSSIAKNGCMMVEGVDLDSYAKSDRCHAESLWSTVKEYELMQQQERWLAAELGITRWDWPAVSAFIEANALGILQGVEDATLKAEIEEAKRRPPLPNGWEYVEDRIAELESRVPEVCTRLIDYDDGEYISDVISEIADSEVDIMNADLLSWLKEEGTGWVEEAVSEGLVDRGDFDIIKAIQAGQYRYYTQELYDNMNEAVEICALKSLLEAGHVAATTDMLDSISEFATNSGDDLERISDVYDGVASAREKSVESWSGHQPTYTQDEVTSLFYAPPSPSIPQKPERACDPKSAEHEARSQASQAAAVQDRPKKQYR